MSYSGEALTERMRKQKLKRISTFFLLKSLEAIGARAVLSKNVGTDLTRKYRHKVRRITGDARGMAKAWRKRFLTSYKLE